METQIETRYYVCALSYNHDDEVTDEEWDFGDFDTYEQALQCFHKTQQLDPQTTFFNDVSDDIWYVKLQLELCEETSDYIECIDVLAEDDIYKD